MLKNWKMIFLVSIIIAVILGFVVARISVRGVEVRTTRVGKGNMDNARDRGEAGALHGFAGCEAQRSQRASVKAADEADKATSPRMLARQLDRRLDCLGT